MEASIADTSRPVTAIFVVLQITLPTRPSQGVQLVSVCRSLLQRSLSFVGAAFEKWRVVTASRHASAPSWSCS